MTERTKIQTFLRSYIGRMLLGTFLIHLLLIPLLFASIILLVERDYKSQFVNFTRTQSFQLATQIGEDVNAERTQRILDDLVLSGQALYAEFENVDQRIRPGVSMLEAEFQEDFYFGEHDDGIYFVVAKLDRMGASGGTLRLGFDESPLSELITKLYLRGALIAAGYLAFTLVLVWFFGNRLTHSIRQLRVAAHKIAGGDAATELAIEGTVTEVSDLAHDLEIMRCELVQQQQQIAIREATQRAILESAAEGIITVNASGEIQSFNKAAESIFGYQEVDVIGTRFANMISASDQSRILLVALPQSLTRLELSGLRKTGHEFHLSVAFSRTHAEGLDLTTILAQDISERKAFEAQLKYLATHDTLTGLPSRTFFNYRLSQAIADVKNSNRMSALLFLDLDRFKYVNDTLGHDFGDKLLVAVADRLRHCINVEDTIARLGGDEFTVILPELRDAEHASAIAQKILSELSNLYSIDGREIYITGSIGISVSPFEGLEPTSSDLTKYADSAMFVAKRQGGNACQFFTSKLHKNLASRLNIEAGLRHALEGNELELHYQPQIDAATGKVTGVEALIRWQRPGYGMVSPLDFISIAEETGLILPIGAWVLRTACAQAKVWQTMGIGPITMAVNVSARQFEQPKLLELVRDTLIVEELDPIYLELELTESIVMNHVDYAIYVLTELKKLGVRMAMDDFGTGYSSLSSLKRFPIDVLKIDRSFIGDIGTAQDNGTIASAIIEMGHALKLKVLAEGVENSAQLNFLREQKCNLIQGYHISKPLPAHVATEFLQQERVVDRRRTGANGLRRG